MKNTSLQYIILLAAIFFLLPIGTNAAFLDLVSQSQDVHESESFIVEVMINTEAESVNAIELNLTFSPDFFEVVDISRGGSVVELWIEDPSFSNTEGTISFLGGMPGGFIGGGSIGKITLLAKSAGNTDISFTSSRVLLNDGLGTEAVLVSHGRNYTITQKESDFLTIRSSRHPNQDQWYNDTTLYFQWDLEDDVLYRYVLSFNPDAPPVSPEGSPIGDVRFEDVGEGIFYFVLAEKRATDEKLGTSSRYRVMIDNTPPEPFEPEIVLIEDKTFLAFSTTDAVSGVDHYEVLKTKVKGAGVWRTAESPYILGEEELRGIIKVKAVDKAGNEQVVKLRHPLRFALIDGLYLFLIFVGLLLISWFWHKRNAQ